MNTEIDALVNRLEELGRLKDVHRTGWVLRGVKDPESVADHSWGTAQLCLLLAPPHIDRCRAAAIATVHDLAEVETGDIPRRAAPHMQPVSPEEKDRRERAAITRLTTSPDGTASWSTLYELWDEYARGTTDEARFVRDMNLIDMCLQALTYQREQRYDPREKQANFPDHQHLDEFFATARDRLVTREGRELFLAIKSRYEDIRGKHQPIVDR